MLLEKTYVAQSRHDLSGLALPPTYELGCGVSARLTVADGVAIQITTSRRIDPAKLEAVSIDRMLGDPYVLVLLQDDSRETDLVRHFIDAVAFISDAPLSVGRTLDDRYIPEDSSDRDLLDRLGSDRVYEATQAAFVSRTFYPLQIDEECVEPLLRRKAGLRLYAEALRAQTPAQEFRDLWRVQESAFRLQDDALVATLANFEPAIALGFTKTELKRLSVLRGQASHAKSRLGVDDLVRVEQECRAQMPRVKALAERVILTKKEWGSPSLAVDAIQFRPYPPS